MSEVSSSNLRLKRYGVRLRPSDGDWYFGEDDDGAYVKLSDVQAEIERLRAARKKDREIVEEALQFIGEDWPRLSDRLRAQLSEEQPVETSAAPGEPL